MVKILLDGMANPDAGRSRRAQYTGTVLPENPLKFNSFLIWQGGQPANFELRMKVRWPKWDKSQGFRNSGIQIRSIVLPGVHPWSVGGYQYDISPGGELDGMFYEERSQRSLGVDKGEKVTVQPDGERWRIEKFLDETQLNALRKPETEWSDCDIVAVGNHLTFSVNGTKVMELVDHDQRHRRLSGVIALQIHVGGAMKVAVQRPVAQRTPGRRHRSAPMPVYQQTH